MLVFESVSCALVGTGRLERMFVKDRQYGILRVLADF